MNRPLKDDIDNLLEGTAEQSQAARKKLGLSQPEPQFDATRFETRIWNSYKDKEQAKTGILTIFRSRTLRPWLLPALAVATILAAVGLSLYNRGEAEQKIQLARFDYTQNSPSTFNFFEKISLTLRETRGLEIRGKAQNFEISAQKVWGLFEFEKKAGNSLAIRTPHGSFHVTGTRFLLFDDGKEALLLVEEGTVQVEKDGKKVAVTANQKYRSRDSELQSQPISPAERAILAAFRNPQVKNEALAISAPKEARPSPGPPPIVFIHVTLFDGNSISGKLIRETEEALIIQPRNFKAITVRKNEIKAAERH